LLVRNRPPSAVPCHSDGNAWNAGLLEPDNNRQTHALIRGIDAYIDHRPACPGPAAPPKLRDRLPGTSIAKAGMARKIKSKKGRKIYAQRKAIVKR